MLDIRVGKKFPIPQDRRKISYSRTPSKDKILESYRDRETPASGHKSSRERLKSNKSDSRLSTPKMDINDKMSLDMGSNLSMKYKQL